MYLQKENASVAVNIVIDLFAFNEKNQGALAKYLQLISVLASDSFKFENLDTVIAFVLDKYIDAKSEQLSEQAYFSFLKRNGNEEFCHTLALLI